MSTLLKIDGSMGEGGGQILRYALALSALTLRPIEVFNIRVKRSNPGLRPQHLTAVKSLATLTDADVSGAEVGSTVLRFKPKKRLHGSFTFDVGTAGSTSLVIQAILPVLLMSEHPSHVVIKGGTNVPLSPAIDYMIHVFKHNLKLFGAEIEIELVKRGHYPRGGGIVELYVNPMKQPLKPVEIVSRGKPSRTKIVSHAVRLPHHVAKRQADSAARILERLAGLSAEVEVETYPPEKDPHLGPGSGILVYVECSSGTRLGGDAVGEKGKPAEAVGEEAARKLVEDFETGMAFDRHMGDMLVPYTFLAEGKSVVGVARITSHLITAIELTKMFFPEAYVEIAGTHDKPGIITVYGVGLSP